MGRFGIDDIKCDCDCDDIGYLMLCYNNEIKQCEDGVIDSFQIVWDDRHGRMWRQRFDRNGCPIGSRKRASWSITEVDDFEF